MIDMVSQESMTYIVDKAAIDGAVDVDRSLHAHPAGEVLDADVGVGHGQMAQPLGDVALSDRPSSALKLYQQHVGDTDIVDERRVDRVRDGGAAPRFDAADGTGSGVASGEHALHGDAVDAAVVDVDAAVDVEPGERGRRQDAAARRRQPLAGIGAADRRAGGQPAGDHAVYDDVAGDALVDRVAPRVAMVTVPRPTVERRRRQVRQPGPTHRHVAAEFHLTLEHRSQR